MSPEIRIQFRKQLRESINSFSLENDSNTPDWILADYLISCLDAWTVNIRAREVFYGRWPWPMPVNKGDQNHQAEAPLGYPGKATKEELELQYNALKKELEQINLTKRSQV